MLTNARICSNVIAEDSISFLAPDFAVIKGKMRLGLMMCFSAALWSCSSITGAPKPAIDTDYTITQYNENLKKLAASPPKDCGAIKQGINQTLTVMDLRYAEFVDDISVESKTKATTADFLLMGLGLAGTAVGGAGAKTIFSALSTGVAAMNTSIDKNYFYEKTLPALISKMNADRKQQQLLIIERYRACDTVDYSWFEAVHDLTDYYTAGTLLGAISSISKDAGVKQTASEKEINELLKNAVHVTLDTQTNPTKESLDTVLAGPNGEEKIMACWIEVSPALFKPGNGSKCSPDGKPNAARLFGKDCKDEQSKVLTCLNTKR